MFQGLHTRTGRSQVTQTWVHIARDKDGCLFSLDWVHWSAAVGREGGGRGCNKVGPGTECREFLFWQETGRKKKTLRPFSEEWLALLSGDAALRSLSDKDATDGLTADDHIKQAQESQWRGRPVPVNEGKLDSDDNSQNDIHEVEAWASGGVLRRQTVVLLRSSAPERESLFVCNDENTNCIGQIEIWMYV